MSMITATAWVPHGHAAQFPTKYDFNDEEFDRIAQLARLRLDDAQEDIQIAKTESGKPGGTRDGRLQHQSIHDDNLREYDLEHYDDTDAEDEDDATQGPGGIFGNIKSLSYYTPGEKDPYVTLNEAEDQEDEEREELQILPTDNLILAARLEDEIAHLEVYVYEDVEDNLYVHHDFMLPAIPLAVEYINYSLGNKSSSESSAFGNFVAVGTMEPDIEIWDLDTVDSVYPSAILGQGPITNAGKSKRKKRLRNASADYHIDAVLSLASNQGNRNVLASASADKTVKLWDLNTTKCASSYSYHSDKVCSLAWHPEEPTALLSGGYDRKVVAADVRSVETSSRKWVVESDVEGVKWDPFDSNYFYVATESGNLHLFDARVTPSSRGSPSPAVWRLQAHDKALSAFDINPTIPGFIATGAADKQVKLWNVQPDGGPSMVVSRDFGVGRVFSTTFAPDAEIGFRLAIAGSKGALQVWDTSTNPAIRRAFATRVAPSSEEVKERLITVTEELNESSDVDEAGEHELEEDWVDEENAEDKGSNTSEDDEMGDVDDESHKSQVGGVRLTGTRP